MLQFKKRKDWSSAVPSKDGKYLKEEEEEASIIQRLLKKLFWPFLAIVVLSALAFSFWGMTSTDESENSTTNTVDTSTSTALSEKDQAFIASVENSDSGDSDTTSDVLYLGDITITQIAKLSSATPRTSSLIYMGALTEAEMAQWGILSSSLALPNELWGKTITGLNDSIDSSSNVIQITISEDGTEGIISDSENLLILKDPKLWKDKDGQYVIMGLSSDSTQYSERELLYVVFSRTEIVEITSLGNIDVVTLSFDESYTILQETQTETWVYTSNAIFIYREGELLGSTQLNEGDSFGENASITNGFFISSVGIIYSVRSYRDEDGNPYCILFPETESGTELKFWITVEIGTVTMKLPVYLYNGESYTLVPDKSDAEFFGISAKASSEETEQFSACNLLNYELQVQETSVALSLNASNSKWIATHFYSLTVSDQFEVSGYRQENLSLVGEGIISLIPAENWVAFEDSINAADFQVAKENLQKVIYDYAEANKDSVVSYLEAQDTLSEADQKLLDSLQETNAKEDTSSETEKTTNNG